MGPDRAGSVTGRARPSHTQRHARARCSPRRSRRGRRRVPGRKPGPGCAGRDLGQSARPSRLMSRRPGGPGCPRRRSVRPRPVVGSGPVWGAAVARPVFGPAGVRSVGERPGQGPGDAGPAATGHRERAPAPGAGMSARGCVRRRPGTQKGRPAGKVRAPTSKAVPLLVRPFRHLPRRAATRLRVSVAGNAELPPARDVRAGGWCSGPAGGAGSRPVAAGVRGQPAVQVAELPGPDPVPWKPNSVLPPALICPL